MEMNWDKVNELIESGHIRKRKHPVHPIWIYNYSQLVQFEQLWTPETLACRGLVADEKGNILARPFPKFFNIEQHQYKVPNEPFEVTAKMDGSLGIMFWYESADERTPSGPVFASRGSFDSDQAKEMEKIWNERYPNWKTSVNEPTPGKGITYLFEIIYPENRIVVDYGPERMIILLEQIDTQTGLTYGSVALPHNVCTIAFENKCISVPKYRFNSIDEVLKSPQLSNAEGYVVRFESGFRCKIKFDEYCRLHSLITEASSISIWETLVNGDSLDSLLEKVPDEFYNWVRNTQNNLLNSYREIEKRALSVVDSVRVYFDWSTQRKEAAIWITDNVGSDLKGIVFNILNGKDYSHIIWTAIRPEYEKPFWNSTNSSEMG